CVPRRDSSRRTVRASARVPMRHAGVRAPQLAGPKINAFAAVVALTPKPEKFVWRHLGPVHRATSSQSPWTGQEACPTLAQVAKTRSEGPIPDCVHRFVGR